MLENLFIGYPDHTFTYSFNNDIIVSLVQYCCHDHIIIVCCIMLLSSLLRWRRAQQSTLNSRTIFILFIKNIVPPKHWGGLISRIRRLSLKNRRTISTTWSASQWGCCWRGCKYQFWSWLTTLQDFGSSGWSLGGKTLKSCSTPQGLLPRRPLWSWSINAN